MSRVAFLLLVVSVSLIGSPVYAQVIYNGRGATAAWRTTAAQMIDQNRKANLNVVVQGTDGSLIPDAVVTVAMTKHAFKFGTAVRPQYFLQSNTSYSAAYAQKITELFNSGTIENRLKWNQWGNNSNQNSGPQIALDGLDWLNNEGLAARGHTMMWPREQSVPDFVVDLLIIENPTQQNLQDLFDMTFSHINDIGTATDGKVDNWDMINEPRSSFDIEDKLIGFTPSGQATINDRTDLRKRWFDAAHNASPSVPMFVNDFGIITGEYETLAVRRRDDLREIVDSLVAAGAQVDGLGFQSHFRYNRNADGTLEAESIAKRPTSPEEVWALLDGFDVDYGLPIHITEFDFVTNVDFLQKDYTRDFLTAAFAHSSVESFSFWGFWEGAINKPEAALFDTDFNANPNGAQYLDLVFDQWWTDESGLSDGAGEYSTRGFLGDYDITVETNGQLYSVETSLDTAGQNVVVTVPVPDPLKGDVDLSGVVEFLDINLFIVLLVAGGYQAEADCDCDGDVDFLDIPQFITILLGG